MLVRLHVRSNVNPAADTVVQRLGVITSHMLLKGWYDVLAKIIVTGSLPLWRGTDHKLNKNMQTPSAEKGGALNLVYAYGESWGGSGK